MTKQRCPQCGYVSNLKNFIDEYSDNDSYSCPVCKYEWDDEEYDPDAIINYMFSDEDARREFEEDGYSYPWD